MVRIHKKYVFEGPGGRVDLRHLFEGRHRLIVYHFPFEPAWDGDCGRSSHLADRLAGGIVNLPARDTSFAAVSPAPIARIESCRKRMGWSFPWLSSLGTTFDEDFRVPPDDGADVFDECCERPGLSVFVCDGDDVLHTYSTYQRRLDALLDPYASVDVATLRGHGRLPPQQARR
jgi:predicted dithiol-disulfide oxidoreductase (DUF899 family)